MYKYLIKISKIKIISAYFIFSFMLVLVSLSFLGCDNTDKKLFKIPDLFQEEKAPFYNMETQDYMTVMVGTGDHFNITYTKDKFSDIEIENSITKVVEGLNQIYKKTGSLPEEQIDIYIFSDENISDFRTNKNRIFYSISDIESEGYLKDLLQGYFDFSNPSIVLGLAGFIEEKLYDIHELKEFFSVEENLRLLDLFAPRFMKEWNEKDEYEIAEIIAVDLVKFIIQEHGLQSLYDINESLKNDWLKEIGSSLIYKANDVKYDNYTYVEKDNYIEIHTEDASYFIEKTKYFNTSTQIENLITTQIKWKKELREYVKTFAPNYYSTHDLEMKINYNLKQRNSYKEIHHVINNSINLLDIDIAVYHELGHIFFPSAYTRIVNSSPMKVEGIAEYISFIICPYSQYRAEYLNVIKEDGIHTDFLPYGENVKRYYERYWKDSDNSDEEINWEYLIDAFAISTLKNEYHPTSSRVSQSIEEIRVFHGRELKGETEGSELTYIQSCSFISYLCNQYSFEMVLDYCTTLKTCEEVFQKSYEELKMDWINYLER